MASAAALMAGVIDPGEVVKAFAPEEGIKKFKGEGEGP
jgi:hypothetical protein